MNILISACLLGQKCRYDGKCFTYKSIDKLKEKYTLIPVCPEVLGGLDIPRSPSEIQGKYVKTVFGEDVTDQYRLGAELAFKIAEKYNCKYAVLKRKSPSCGNDKVYDGSFSGTLVKGLGITAEKLNKNGIEVYNENQIDELLEVLK